MTLRQSYLSLFAVALILDSLIYKFLHSLQLGNETG
jgi:hypothetical protein